MSFVDKEMFDGLLSVVVNGVSMYWSPPLPPLPVTVTLLNEAVPPKEFMPDRVESTSKGMPEIGTLPMEVFATTSAVPFNSKDTDDVSVTAAKNASNAPSSSAVSGWLENDS